MQNSRILTAKHFEKTVRNILLYYCW